MTKNMTLILGMLLLALSACAPQAVATPTPSPTDEPVVVVATPAAELPTATASAPATKSYTNSSFGLAFQFPADWFGPDEYISEQTLRVAVGSDVVYPYGEVPEEPSQVKNSYSIVIQYTKHNQNTIFTDTYQVLAGLKDGESVSGVRGLTTRVRQIQLGRFAGFEYTSTLSETAQTDWFYTREVILIDQQSQDVLTVMGQPNNVEVGAGANWRDVYRALDETNAAFFHEIVESTTIQ